MIEIKKSGKRAFSLAEMMIILLITSIIMAASMPIITKRTRNAGNNIWQYTSNVNQIYYGMEDKSGVAIGANHFEQADNNPRMLINTGSDTQKHLLVKAPNATTGENDIVGSMRFGSAGDVEIGKNIKAADGATAFGWNAFALKNSVAAGENVNAGAENSMAVGNKTNAMGLNSVSVGFNDSYAGAEGAVAIGDNANAVSKNSVSAGYTANAIYENSIAIGCANAYAENSIVVGYHANASGVNSIAAGVHNVNAIGVNSIAIGSKSNAYAANTIAISHNANLISYFSDAVAQNSIVISSGGSAYGNDSVVLGGGVWSPLLTKKDNSMVIGASSASVLGVDSIVIGNNVISGSGLNSYATYYSDRLTIIGRDLNVSGNNTVCIATDIQPYGNIDNATVIESYAGGGSISSGGVCVGNNPRVGTNSVSLCRSALGNNSVAIASGVNGDNAVGIGHADSNGNCSVLIGSGGTVTKEGCIALGYNARTEAYSSVAIGDYAHCGDSHNPFHSDTGNYSVSVGQGSNAMFDYSVALGSSTLANGTYCSVLGSSANSYDSNSVAVGYYANTLGDACVALGVGSTAGQSMSWSYDGSNMTIIYASNSAIAIGAGSYVDKANSVAIGYNSNSGDWTGKTFWGASNVIVLGNSTCTPYVYIPGDLYVGGHIFFNNGMKLKPGFSDRRLKNINGEYTAGLSEINKLQTYRYTFKADKTKEPRVGVIAQDLQKIFPDAVKKDDKGYLFIRKDDMFYAMVNSIPQLDKMVDNLNKSVNEIVAKVQRVEYKFIALTKVNTINNKRILVLQNKNKKLKVRVSKLEKKARDRRLAEKFTKQARVTSS